MTFRGARRYLLPLILIALALLLLVRVFLLDRAILVPEELEFLVLVSLLGMALVAAIHTMMRIWIQHLRSRTLQQMRRETLAEHGRFLGRLDHELKNPLTTLRAGLSTMALTELDRSQRRLIAAMETETVRLSELVTDLRKLVDLEAHPLSLQPVNMLEFVEQVVSLEQGQFEAGGRSLTCTSNLARPVWVVDEDLLALALHNLLDNAFKYTQPSDSIQLSISGQQELVIQVADTGVGIPAEALPHVTEELYRAEQVQDIPGQGIGLALVKVIVERHEGSLSITSGPEMGTRVTIRLPLLSQQ